MYIVIALAVVIIGAGVGGWWYWNNYLVEEHSLVILHPHSSEFADDVIADFQAWVMDTEGYSITVAEKQLDSGACYDQVKAWDGTPEADIWWGGGEYYFRSATKKDLMYGYTTANDAQIPDTLHGWPLKAETANKNEWYAAALSSFGFMWNEDYLSGQTIPLAAPTSWEDLTNASYKGHIVMCDPSSSGSTTASLLMGLQYLAFNQSLGYETAWGYYANLTGNVGLWTTASHEVPLKVVAGDYGIGIVIDYYYFEEEIADAPVGFSLGNATMVSPDPAGILDGATNLDEAKLFMDYITSVRGQNQVGTIRGPVNPGSTATAPVLNLYDPDVPLFPFNKTINDMAFSAHRKMFSKWLVNNKDLAQQAWALIKECEETGKTGANYMAAVEAFCAPPENYTSVEDLITIEGRVYGPEGASWPYDEWETWGATQFQLAIDEATLELAS
jgi:ABC-type Fe3+ transport system substrate-binding protein